MFIEPPPTLDWTADSKVSKAGRRHPCLNETGEQTYSYQNLSCAAVLREQGFEVTYLHCPTQRLDCAATEAVIKSVNPLAIVIMKEHINARVAESLSATAKKAGVRVIWCGPFVTALHESEIVNESVDYILRQEWDYAVAELLHALIDPKPLAAIAGLTGRIRTGKTVINPSGRKSMI